MLIIIRLCFFVISLKTFSYMILLIIACLQSKNVRVDDPEKKGVRGWGEKEVDHHDNVSSL